MEIPLSRLDQIQSNISNIPSIVLNHKIFSNTNKFSFYYDFSSFSSKNIKTPFNSLITCSSIKQNLQPRPKPKPLKPNQIELQRVSEKLKLSSPQIQKSIITTNNNNNTSGLCCEIRRLVRFKRYNDALELFEIIECETGYNDVNESTYDALVQACIELKSIRGVKRVYNFMNKTGFQTTQYMDNRVLLMHVKCGMMNDAKRVFDEMPRRDAVSWSIIILGLVDNGDYEVAFDMFLFMWRENHDARTRIFVTMIRASADMGRDYVGKQFHSNALKMGINENIFVSCGLINMYSKCGFLEDAQHAFDEMPVKTVVGWNTIIAGYALHGYNEEALNMYLEMQDSGVKIDHFTYTIIIGICARLASVAHAKQAHAGLVRNGFGSDLEANTALVDFYGKWGKIEDARRVFDRMPSKSLTSWNAMIAGYSNHGKGPEAVRMFEQMLREGQVPDHVTFLAVLYGCAHSGLSDQGWEIFESMARKYNVKPRAMHYACMIQLLGREGLLDEALAMIRDAPFRPTENMWDALLNACRVHKNLELGKFAAEKLYGMEPDKLMNYIVLMNIYISSGRSDEAAHVMQTLRSRGLRMLPECTEDIYKKLDMMMREIAKHGYVPSKESLLPDVDKQEERVLLYHSEKLAIAFGLISTSASTSLQVVQSHRICSDCHDVIKLIAKISQREILVRDASRFHHFKDGTCSCEDYW
ncbi:hypothetical protein AQUCO_00500419v1 [Aquilegia coerulea]|uniref:DYW domain-containing protein n=1 Tax=Aquilegia coerulea TaxID=218851 RepID=A0A2G5ERU3_AQUCA|nr:hypothetical protein AQUCO_00500419v1 [Aquilegia coerulea]